MTTGRGYNHDHRDAVFTGTRSREHLSNSRYAASTVRMLTPVVSISGFSGPIAPSSAVARRDPKYRMPALGRGTRPVRCA